MRLRLGEGGFNAEEEDEKNEKVKRGKKKR